MKIKSPFFLLLGISLSTLAEQHYDEIRDGRQVRPQYEEALKIYNAIPESKRKELKQESKKATDGQYEFDLLPRILTTSEVDYLRSGIEQRAKALVAFLQDHYSGSKRYLKQNIIPAPVMDRVLRRSIDYPLQGLLKPHQISFTYGPDAMRLKDPKSPKGYRWVFLEDNHGDVGGEGDLEHAPNLLFKLVPEYKNVLTPLNKPEKYFDDLVARYQSRANGEKVALFTMHPHVWGLTKRFENALKDRGVEVVTSRSSKQVKFGPKGAFLESKDVSGNLVREDLGYLVLGGDVWDLDWSHPVMREKALVEFAQDYLENRTDLSPAIRKELQESILPPQGQRNLDRIRKALASAPGPDVFAEEEAKRLPGLAEAILQDRVRVNDYFGAEFIDDKEFFLYVPKLIQFYLGEKPIVDNIPIEEDWNKATQHPRDHVLKRVTSFGGKSVWVGKNLSNKEFREAMARAKKAPGDHQVFKYVHPSLFDGKIVDWRGFAQVDTEGIYVGRPIFGRSSDAKIAKGKVNLSSGGSESAVMEVEEPCLRSLSKASGRQR